jgi:hypothetical protein
MLFLSISERNIVEFPTLTSRTSSTQVSEIVLIITERNGMGGGEEKFNNTIFKHPFNYLSYNFLSY